MKVIHLKTGWKNENFEEEVNELVSKQEKEGFEYYDIKISSKDNDCLVIFKKRDDLGGMMAERGK